MVEVSKVGLELAVFFNLCIISSQCLKIMNVLTLSSGILSFIYNNNNKIYIFHKKLILAVERCSHDMCLVCGNVCVSLLQ